MLTEIFKTDQCPICQKEFIPASMHAYKLLNKKTRKICRFCSYTCFRRAQRNVRMWGPARG